MPIITLKVYRDRGKNKREIYPECLLKVIEVESTSEKPLNKERAKQILSRAFPELGKVWYVWEHPDGWLKSIEYQGIKAWILVCRSQ